MKPVLKYNICKAVSTVLTVGTPIITLCSCSQLFIHRSDTAVSAAGVFAILLSLLFLKDKIMKNFKMPSAFIISICLLVMLSLVESLLAPLKYVCIATICTTGIDELTFKRWYKSLELTFPKGYESVQMFGFITVTTDKLMRGCNDEK